MTQTSRNFTAWQGKLKIEAKKGNLWRFCVASFSDRCDRLCFGSSFYSAGRVMSHYQAKGELLNAYLHIN
jgi:hypothetical protein